MPARNWTMMVIFWGGLSGTLAIAAIGWFITSALSKQIGAAVGQVQSSSAELQAAANQQATGAKEQATAMNEITTTISELLATSRQIAESAQRVARPPSRPPGRRARATAPSTDPRIRYPASGARWIRSSPTCSSWARNRRRSAPFSRSSTSSPSRPTSSPSMRPSRRRAPARAGKRFAVVADEIRKLADRVGGSTKEIRTLIDDVQERREHHRHGDRNRLQGGRRGDRGNSATWRPRFQQISGLVATTTEAAREIELSTKQQTTAVEQVNVAIANVAQASRETEASSARRSKRRRN